jgi:hypothetical protein
MAWEGRWVSVQPVAVQKSAPQPAATPKPTPRPTATPKPTPTLSPTPLASLVPSIALEPSPSVEPTPAEIAALPESVASASPGANSGTSPPSKPASDNSSPGLLFGLIALVVAALAVTGGLAVRAQRRP